MNSAYFKDVITRSANLLIAPHSSLADLAERRKARLASALSLALSGFLLLGMITAYLRVQNPRDTLITFGIPCLISLIAYVFTRTKYYSLGSFIFIVGICTSPFVNIVMAQRDVRITLLFYIPLGLIFASALLSGRATFLLTGLVVAATIWMLPLFGTQLPENYGGVLGLLTATSIILILLGNYRNELEKLRLNEIERANRELQALSANLETRINARTMELEQVSQQAMVHAAQLQAITDISQTIVLEQDTNKLLPMISRLISEKFGYYHVGIFIINHEGYAVLRAANSDGGRQLLLRGHKLRVGATGLVGYVAQQGIARIALDVGADAAYFHNPDLPNTHSEVALPLKIGTQVIGVLDVQSTQISAFSDGDIDILSTLANQVGTSIQNAQLFEKTRDTLSGYIQATQQDWKRISRQEGRSGLVYKSDGSLKPADALDLGVQNNFSSRDIILNSDKDTRNISVPVRVRDQIVGVINIQADDVNREWNDNEISLVQTISERAAFALENARLFEEAGRRAQQERLISDISSSISASTDFDRIMQITIEEIGRALGATRTFIQLEAPNDINNANP